MINCFITDMQMTLENVSDNPPAFGNRPPAESGVISLVPEDSLILVANYFSQSNPKLACFVVGPSGKTFVR
jgi:hypothetical protein